MVTWSKIQRPLAVAIVLLIWVGILSDRSFALFSDTATLTDNAILTGTADLQISNSQNGSSTVYADARAGFAMQLNPGATDEHFFLLKNVGADGVPLSLVAQVVTPPGASSQELMDDVEVEFIPVDSDGVTQGPSVRSTLSDLITQPLSMGPVVLANKAQRFKMRTRLVPQYSQQSASAQYSLLFTGVQSTS